MIRTAGKSSFFRRRAAPQTTFYAAARLCLKLPVERDYENYRPHHSSQPRQPSSRTLEAILFNNSVGFIFNSSSIGITYLSEIELVSI